MQRGSSYKAAPFKMKGYSYPGTSPVRQTNYFKTDLFTSPHVSDKTKKQIEEDKQFIQSESDKVTNKVIPYVDQDPGGAKEKGGKSLLGGEV